MALQGSGQISLSNIATEMNQISQNISLTGLSTHSTLNDQSPFKPNEFFPHGMAEFYAYDHNYSSFKALMGGIQNDSGKWFEFCEDEVRFFYAHDGGKELPMVGDRLYINDRGNYVPFGAHYTKILPAIQGPEGGETSYIATTDASGKVTRLDTCEGDVAGPGKPGAPDGGEDPFGR